MKKVILLTCLALISCIMSHAQSPLWVIGNNLIIDGNPQALPTPSGPNVYEGQQARATHNAYHNPVSGDLLFFIIDGIIYDKDGYIIDDLIANSASGENILGFAETVIVPDPVYEDKTLY